MRMLGRLRPLFSLGLGARLGNGRQYMSWISLEDEVRALLFAILNSALCGPVNLTGPAPVTNAEFTTAMGRAVNRPTPLLLPGFALRTLLGEFADEGLLGGQRAIPAALERADFRFHHNTIGEALAYATSERGACHMRAFTVFAEDPFDQDALSGDVIGGQNGCGIKWSMGFCDFWGTCTTTIMSELMSAGLGKEVTSEELDVAGERIWNLTRWFNLKAGFTAKDDSMSKKVLEEALGEGAQDGATFTAEDQESIKQKYYAKRGWDKGGVPSAEKMDALGLGNFKF